VAFRDYRCPKAAAAMDMIEITSNASTSNQEDVFIAGRLFESLPG
jgi:hypothetical protein